MDRRETKIQENRVDVMKSMSIRMSLNVGIAVLNQHNAFTKSRETLTRTLQIVGIAINAQQTAARKDTRKETFRMSPQPHGAVYQKMVRLRLEGCNHLRKEDRFVHKKCCLLLGCRD